MDSFWGKSYIDTALDKVFYQNYIGEIQNTSILSSFTSPVERYLYIIYLLNEK